MIYGLIYYKGRGKHAFLMRQFTKFTNPEEESRITPFIETIIEEETGDGFLLAEKIAAYVREHHLDLEFPIDLTGISRAAFLSDHERMEMLETSVRVLAHKLEESQHKAWGLEYAHWCVQGENASTEYLLNALGAIIGIAKADFKCKHLVLAHEKYEKLAQELLH